MFATDAVSTKPATGQSRSLVQQPLTSSQSQPCWFCRNRPGPGQPERSPTRQGCAARLAIAHQGTGGATLLRNSVGQICRCRRGLCSRAAPQSELTAGGSPEWSDGRAYASYETRDSGRERSISTSASVPHCSPKNRLAAALVQGAMSMIGCMAEGTTPLPFRPRGDQRNAGLGQGRVLWRSFREVRDGNRLTRREVPAEVPGQLMRAAGTARLRGSPYRSLTRRLPPLPKRRLDEHVAATSTQADCVRTMANMSGGIAPLGTHIE